MENQPKASRKIEETTIQNLIDHSISNDLHAATKNTGQVTHHNEAKEIQSWDKDDTLQTKSTPKDTIDEKDLPPFQAPKPII